MRISAARTLPPPAELRNLTKRIAWGEVAASLPTSELVILLPHHANHAEIRFGESYITWVALDEAGDPVNSELPAIAVRPGQRVRWSICEQGQSFTGEAVVDVSWAGSEPEVSITGDWPSAAMPVASQSPRQVTSDGKVALFALVSALEKHVADCLEQANRYVARELEGRVGDAAEGWADSSNHGAVDRVALDTIGTELMFGRDDEESSAVLRMARRAALTSINNQPLGNWWAVNLRARAEERIRKHIGDPHIGPKIRRFTSNYLATAENATVEDLLEQYRRANPRDQAGRNRLLAAISAGKTIDATSSSLSLFTNVLDHTEDAPAVLSDSYTTEGTE